MVSTPGFAPGSVGPETLPWDRGRPNLRSAMLSLNGEMVELQQVAVAIKGVPNSWMVREIPNGISCGI